MLKGSKYEDQSIQIQKTNYMNGFAMVVPVVFLLTFKSRKGRVSY
jgi:hypothetical protein